MPYLLAQTESGSLSQYIDTLARTPLSRVMILVGILTVLRILAYPYLKNTLPHLRKGVYSWARFLNETFDAIIYAAVLVFLVLRPFAVQMFRIPSGSMVYTLMVNDFILANKAIYRYTDPKAGDIVVFRPPLSAVSADQVDDDGQVKVDFIKRCIGTPGQTIEVKNNVLFRNNQPIDEPYKVFTQQLSVTDFRKLSKEEVDGQLTLDFKLVKYQGKYWPLTISGDFVNDTERTAHEFLVGSTDLMHTLRNLPPEPVPEGYYLMMGDNRNGSFDSRGWGLVPRESIIGRAEFIVFPLPRMGRAN